MESIYSISWFLMSSAIVIMAVAYLLKRRITEKRRYWSSDRSDKNELALKILDGLWSTFSACALLGFTICFFY